MRYTVVADVLVNLTFTYNTDEDDTFIDAETPPTADEVGEHLHALLTDELEAMMQEYGFSVDNVKLRHEEKAASTKD